ncbi:hypothetical protein [Cetobacterium sp.]|uniref:hypothetical protein n=1 Tax=Cetobacterium sp. TaxID=2071632 RepID=UPI002FCADD6D
MEKRLAELEEKLKNYEEQEQQKLEQKMQEEQQNFFLDDYVKGVDSEGVKQRIRDNSLDPNSDIDKQYLREVKAIQEFWKDLKAGNENYKKNMNYVAKLTGRNSLDMRYEVYSVLGKI